MAPTCSHSRIPGAALAAPPAPRGPVRRRRAAAALQCLAATALFGIGPVLAQTGRLEPGDTQLDSGEYVDVYTHEARAGEGLVVAIASTELDPYLIVLDPAGAEVAQVDDSPGYGLNVHVTLELPGDGTYVIGVTSARPGETGAYALTLQPSGTADARSPVHVGPGAQHPDGLAGTYSDGALTVELQEAADGVRGRLLLGGREYRIDAAGTGASLQGTYGAEGQRTRFRASLAGDVLTFDIGGAAYALQRLGMAGAVGAPPAAPTSQDPPVQGDAAQASPGQPAPGHAPAPMAEPQPSPAQAGTPEPQPAQVQTPPPPATSTTAGAATRFFFLPSDTTGPHNIGKPRIATDPSGGIHVAVPGRAGGNAYYMYCPANCTDPAQLATVTLPTSGTAANAMIALDASGQPQVLLSAYQAVVYATCAGDCRQQSAWTTTEILRHDMNADREVTGEAFALDPQGRPRFVMDAYRAFLGIGQPTAITLYVACDTNCHEPASWRQSRMADQIWQESTLRFSADGRAHVATVASAEEGDIGGYMTCAVDCESGLDDAWRGLGLTWAFSDRTVERIDPAITLDLTRDGRPRVMLLGRDETGARDLSYWACDAADCTVEANWRANWLIDGDDLGAGLDLTLDAQDRPRAAYNADDNVFLLACDGDCLADDDSGWTLLPVDLAGTIPVDEVIPFHNCNIAAWLLRYPSLALGADGLPRVAYIAEDISGVLGTQNPLYPECTPGVDMAIGRFTRLASLTPPE